MGAEIWGVLGFVALVCVEGYISVIVEGAHVRECRRLVLCTVGTAG
jgi:hypothetical protein